MIGRPSLIGCHLIALLLLALRAVAGPYTMMGTAPFTTHDPTTGELLDVYSQVGSPPPAQYSDFSSDPIPTPSASAKLLSGIPVAQWYSGCSPTSAGMLFGYYDNQGYGNMLAAPITGGLDTAAERDLIATSAHRTDYWKATNSAGPDPWVGNWTEHTWSTCVADYMGTSQWKWDFNLDSSIDNNPDGSTILFSNSSASKLYDYIPSASYGLPRTELSHGLRLFAESRGYDVAYENGRFQVYTQKLDTLYTGGFSFANWMTEIDSERPLLMQMAGHTMLGFGYDAANTSVYFYDTWNTSTHSVTWGSAYSGYSWLGVTALKLDAVPEPGTVVLFAGGLALLIIRRRRA